MNRKERRREGEQKREKERVNRKDGRRKGEQKRQK